LKVLIGNYQPRSFTGKEQSVSFDQTIVYQDFNFLRNETLTFERREYSSKEKFLFRFPKKIETSALLLIFHSCNQTANHWFRTGERQRIIGAAIDLGYGILVFQSTDRIHRCWSLNTDIYQNEDIEMVVEILKKFYNEFPKFVSLPRFTFGESSGGLFSSILTINQRYPIQGQILYISIVVPEVLFRYVKKESYPPTVWIHMLRDVEFASEERINSSMKVFSHQKIPFTDFAIEPICLNSLTFHQRIPSITDETSRYLFYRLVQNHWLNIHNYLVFNPRRKLNWKNFLFPQENDRRDENDIIQNIQAHRDVITEFLNVIYGEHAISYERSFEALKWLQDLNNNQSQDISN